MLMGRVMMQAKDHHNPLKGVTVSPESKGCHMIAEDWTTLHGAE